MHNFVFNLCLKWGRKLISSFIWGFWIIFCLFSIYEARTLTRHKHQHIDTDKVLRKWHMIQCNHMCQCPDPTHWNTSSIRIVGAIGFSINNYSLKCRLILGDTFIFYILIFQFHCFLSQVER
jgi:hypothetical protein